MIGVSELERHLRNVLSKFGQGAFYAHHSTSQSVNATTETLVSLDTEVVDVCSWFTGSTFTPKQPGYYLLFGRAYIAVDADFEDAVSTMYFWIRKNAAAGVPQDAAATLREGLTLTCVTIAEANGTTDTFDLAVHHDGAGAMNINRAAFGGVFVSYNNP